MAVAAAAQLRACRSTPRCSRPQLTYDCQFPAWSIGPTPNEFVPNQLFDAVATLPSAAEADRGPDQPERVGRLRLRTALGDDKTGVVSIAKQRGPRRGAGRALPADHHRLGADRGAGARRQAGPGHQQRARRRPGQPAPGDGAAELQAADDVQPVPGARPAARARRDRATACCRCRIFEPNKATLDKLGGDAHGDRQRLQDPGDRGEAAVHRSSRRRRPRPGTPGRSSPPGSRRAGKLDQQGDLRLAAQQRAPTPRSAATLDVRPEADTTSGRRTQTIKQIQNGDWVTVWPQDRAAAPSGRRVTGRGPSPDGRAARPDRTG